MTQTTHVTKHTGSCHCGAMRFEVEVDATQGGRCNCSICTKLNPTGALVKPAAFRLLTDEAALGSYVWGAKMSTRYFCKTCGVYGFGRGHLAELGGDFVSVNLNCLDDIEHADVQVRYWDGRHDNWEAGQRETPWPTLGEGELKRRAS
jgi:hypothetical protein